MEAVFWFVILGLAVWRVSYLLVNEDGPFDIFLRIRVLFGAEPTFDESTGILHPPYPRNVVGKALLCMWCTSIWVALPFALRFLPQIDYFIGYWLALSGFAIFANQVMTVLENLECTACSEDAEPDEESLPRQVDAWRLTESGGVSHAEK